MDDYMRCEKGDMSLKVRKGKDPHLFLVSITLMSATNAELARVAPHEVDKSRIESRTRKRRLPEERSFFIINTRSSARGIRMHQHRSGDNLRNVGGYHAGFQLVKLVHGWDQYCDQCH
ncbi:hypothetical protein G3M48_001003 [Beauveria asiatica]|uniref:Uncharacterized protein n=1 Tax=Beauveria asiatica TaxID=1069075 RepID=A0AAW0RZN8_9HYPO